jgi:hypothetical protein
LTSHRSLPQISARESFGGSSQAGGRRGERGDEDEQAFEPAGIARQEAPSNSAEPPPIRAKLSATATSRMTGTRRRSSLNGQRP